MIISKIKSEKSIEKIVSKAKEEYKKISTNVSFLKLSNMFVLIDNNTGDKILSFMSVKRDNKLFLKNKDYEKIKKHLNTQNILIFKKTYELFAIKDINHKSENYVFNNKEILCTVLKIEKITNF